MRLVPWLTIAGCGGGASPVCEFELVVDDSIGETAPVDCGTLPSPPILGPFDQTPWFEARDCALAMATFRGAHRSAADRPL